MLAHLRAARVDEYTDKDVRVVRFLYLGDVRETFRNRRTAVAGRNDERLTFGQELLGNRDRAFTVQVKVEDGAVETLREFANEPA